MGVPLSEARRIAAEVDAAMNAAATRVPLGTVVVVCCSHRVSGIGGHSKECRARETA